jgi:pre-mRNA-splicing helicase BRR2
MNGAILVSDERRRVEFLMSGRPPGKPDLSGYNCVAISSLVLTADRSALPRRDTDPDGAPC